MIQLKYYIYMIECSNGHYYTGYTTNVERRYREHLQGNAKCKYTRSFPPKLLVASWCVGGDRSQALKIECEVKKLSKVQKQRLVNEPSRLQNLMLERGYTMETIRK